jgi:hypothetical protein
MTIGLSAGGQRIRSLTTRGMCCAEIEVDGLQSYPHIRGGRPHRVQVNRQRKDVNRVSEIVSH